jgi:hypothetical protein
LHGIWWAFGDHDGVFLLEAPCAGPQPRASARPADPRPRPRIPA